MFMIRDFKSPPAKLRTYRIFTHFFGGIKMRSFARGYCIKQLHDNHLKFSFNIAVASLVWYELNNLG